MDRYQQLGEAIARSILSVGDEIDGEGQKDKVHRIAFKGGTYPNKETDLGGLCEAALASHIRGVLIDLDVLNEFREHNGNG